MTWIDWATVACAVYAALLSTLIAIRQQLRIRGEWELRRYQQRRRVEVDRVDLLKRDLAVPTADPGIQAGDPVYWDGSGNPVPGQLFPGCATSTPAKQKPPLFDVDVDLSDNNQAVHLLDAAVLGVALDDSQPVDPGRKCDLALGINQ